MIIIALRYIQIGLLLLIFNKELFSQNYPRWYNCEIVPTKNPSCSNYSTLADSFDLNLLNISGIELNDIMVSYFSLSEELVPLNYSKSRLYGIIGKNKAGEIGFIFDRNLDYDLTNDSLHFFPNLELNDEIEYNTFYIYPTDHMISHRITFDFIKDNQIYSISKSIGFKIYSRYDSLKNKLYYLDKFKVCFTDKLVLEEEIVGEQFKIQTRDVLPWMNKYLELFITNPYGVNSKVYIKDLLIGANGQKFTIDTVDLFERRFRIKKVYEENNIFNIVGRSLWEEREYVLPASNNLKIVHFWGSWCQPCIKNLPSLKELHDSQKDIDFLGVCVDSDRNKAKSVALQFKINWNNIYFDFDDFKKNNNYNIHSYPTYMLIDGKNEIIGKFNKIDELKKAIYLTIR